MPQDKLLFEKHGSLPPPLPSISSVFPRQSGGDCDDTGCSNLDAEDISSSNEEEASQLVIIIVLACIFMYSMDIFQYFFSCICCNSKIFVSQVSCHSSEGQRIIQQALDGLSVTDDQLTSLFTSDKTVKEMRDMILNGRSYIK